MTQTKTVTKAGRNSLAKVARSTGTKDFVIKKRNQFFSSEMILTEGHRGPWLYLVNKNNGTAIKLSLSEARKARDWLTAYLRNERKQK